MSASKQSQTGASIVWRGAPTTSVNVGGTKFVYRQLGRHRCTGYLPLYKYLHIHPRCFPALDGRLTESWFWWLASNELRSTRTR